MWKMRNALTVLNKKYTRSRTYCKSIAGFTIAKPRNFCHVYVSLFILFQILEEEKQSFKQQKTELSSDVVILNQKLESKDREIEEKQQKVDEKQRTIFQLEQ